MKLIKRTLLAVATVALALTLAGAPPASAKDYKLTVVAGHPPIFLWVTLARDYMVPEIDKRLAEAGGKDKIVWNQAYGGTIAKLGGVLEAIEEGVADMGFVGTIFEAAKMPLHNVSYMTPFGSEDIFAVVDTMDELQAKVPELAQEWTKYNQVYLGGAALDTYGVLTNFPVKTVDDIKGHKLAAPGPSANWIKGTGAVAVAANLNTYYNGIQTGVFEGTLTFMTAGRGDQGPRGGPQHLHGQLRGPVRRRDQHQQGCLRILPRVYAEDLQGGRGRVYQASGQGPGRPGRRLHEGHGRGRGQDHHPLPGGAPEVGQHAAQRAPGLGQVHGGEGLARQGHAGRFPGRS